MDNSDGGKIMITVPLVFFIVLLNWNKKTKNTTQRLVNADRCNGRCRT